jgi:hypothetical protein
MAGMYPDDQTLSLFGEEVSWPGLDPDTGKFTDGSFTDPLVKPSFIPAGTLNLVLDNLANLIAAIGGSPNNTSGDQLKTAFLSFIASHSSVTTQSIKNFVFPVGKMIRQYPDERTPVEAGLPGEWEVWSGRSILYGVSASSPPSSADYYSLAGTTIAAGATPVVCYHKAGDDYRLYQFISQTAAYTVPVELDPVKWAYIQPGIIDGRQKCGNALADDDYEIGDQISTGSYQGKYITEIIVPGGKFWGVEGGFRPTFVSGGVQESRIKNIEGKLRAGHAAANFPLVAMSGAFYDTQVSPCYASGTSSADVNCVVGFDPSRVVPTGSDNAPTNLSVRIWRRTA